MSDTDIATIEPALNRNQIAQIFGVSANTIDKWIGEGLPVETVGGNGQAYEFKHSDCLSWNKETEETGR